MKKTLLALSILLVSALAALLAAPSFIDWNPYRGAIADWLSERTGHPVALDGPMSLSLLPSPALSVEGLRIASAEGEGARNLAAVPRLTARLNLLPLLAGRAEVTEVVLSAPELALELQPDGSLAPPRTAPTAPAAEQPGWLRSVELRRLVVQDGRAMLHDAASGRELLAEAVRMELQADEGGSRIEAEGGFTLNGTGLGFTLTGRRPTAGATAVPLQAELTLPDEAGRIGFSGSLGLGEKPQLEGSVTAAADSAGRFLALLTGPATAMLQQGALAAQPLQFRSGLVAADRRLSLSDGELVLGETSLRTQLSFDLPTAPGAAPHGNIGLRTNLLPLDGLLPATLASDAPPAAMLAALEGALRGIPEGLQLDLEAEGARLRGRDIRRLQLAFVSQADVLQIGRLSALLPGETELSLAGTLGRSGPASTSLEGQLRGQDLRSTLDWAGLLPPDMPATLLRNIALSGRLQLAPQSLGLRDLSLELDDVTLAGSLFVDRSFAGRLDGAFAGQRLSLERYRPLLARLGLPLPAVQTYPELVAALSAGAGDPQAVKLALDLGALNLSPLPPLERFRIDAERRAQALDLRGLEVISDSGVTVKAQATVPDIADPAAASGVVEVVAPDGGALLPFLPAGPYRLDAVPGPVSLRAQVRTEAETALVNADLKLGAENSLQLAGSLASLEPSRPQADATLRVTVKDAALLPRLLPEGAAAALPPLLRQFDLYGRLVLAEDRLMVSDIQGALGTTAIAATLAVNDIGKPEARRAVLGIRAGDIDLAALLPEDGSAARLAAAARALPAPLELSLTAASLRWGTHSLSGVALLGRASAEVVEIEQLDGTLGSGRIGLALKQDAARTELGLTGQAVPLPAEGLGWNGWSVGGGTADLEARLVFPADAPLDMARLQDGSLLFLMKGGSVGGIDLPAIASRVAEGPPAAPAPAAATPTPAAVPAPPPEPADAALAALDAALLPGFEGGTTPVEQFYARLEGKDGTVRIVSGDLRSAAGRIAATGDIDLQQNRLAVQLEAQLAAPEGVPGFSASLLGPVATPRRSLQAAELSRFLARGTNP